MSKLHACSLKINGKVGIRPLHKLKLDKMELEDFN